MADGAVSPGPVAVAGAPDAAAAPAGAAGAGGIDVQALAEKVYNLLLADVRLGRARGSSVESPRRTGEG